jgi:hypothetical protein
MLGEFMSCATLRILFSRRHRDGANDDRNGVHCLAVQMYGFLKKRDRAEARSLRIQINQLAFYWLAA